MTRREEDEAGLAVLAATSIRAIAVALMQGLYVLGLPAEAVAWLDSAGLQFEPPEAATPLLKHIATVVFTGEALDGYGDSVPYLLDTGISGGKVVVLVRPGYAAMRPEQTRVLALAGRRLSELFSVQKLQVSVQRLEHSERLQRALFAIADMAASGLDMQNLLRGLHRIIAELMYAENFYIALYDRQREMLRFAYFTDVMDGQLYHPDQEFSTEEMRNTITLRLIRHAKPMRGPSSEVAMSLGLDRNYAVGTPSVDFMGVPMRRDGQVFGILTVQSYEEGRGYTESDQNVLAFVAEHVLNAVERKLGQETLERHVIERTQELADANARLQEQLRERERGVHLQATLYRIAALSHNQGDNEAFYHSIHQAVGELLNAENFCIALISEGGTHLLFPYYVDTSGEELKARVLGRGMSEYGIRRAETVLMSADDIDVLIADGEVDAATYGAPALSWLGAPLLGPDGVIGVVVVQSYRPDLSYTAQDADLLTFVSYQIASTLQRRRQDEALRMLNIQLEQRVHERTRELRQQIAVRERVEEQLKHQVMHDSLTGLPNRLYLRDRLEHALALMLLHPEQCFALLYLDVDRFKLLNDRFGHLLGDAVLREVSSRLLTCVRKTDVVSRLSGDEFSILLEDCPQASVACLVAQNIMAQMAEVVQVGEHALEVSLSIGIAMGEPRYRTVDEVLHDADTALYRAKATGRQRFVLYR